MLARIAALFAREIGTLLELAQSFRRVLDVANDVSNDSLQVTVFSPGLPRLAKLGY
jgi:hypothetical protein